MMDRAHWIGLGVIALATAGTLLPAAIASFRDRGRAPESGGDGAPSATPAAENSGEAICVAPR
jgi:hypothetical protein